MSNKSPIFPILEPQHFSDYGCDPQFNYFQVLEEARKHKRETRSLDALHCKLQKPIGISKEEFKKSKKRKWWRNALRFLKWNKDEVPYALPTSRPRVEPCYRAVSGPIYGGEYGKVGSCRISRPSSGPLAGTLAPAKKGDIEIPYLSLRELNLDHLQRMSTSSLPIYLVA